MNSSHLEARPATTDGSSMEHRGFVGPAEAYDVFSAVQFNLLTFLGLREQHSLLDIGCGSLRAGRLFIPYLLPGRYHGLEPEKWLIDAAVRDEIGADLIRLKQPAFAHNADFTLGGFGKQFDFLLAHSVFSHATAEQIRRCLAEARQVMNRQSLFAATFVEGDRDYTGAVWTLWAKYTFAFMEKAAAEAGLRCRRIDWPSPDFQQWVVFFLPGNNDAERLASSSAADSNLRLELDFCRQRLDRLQRHPYLRAGFAVNRAFKWIGFAWRRLLRGLGSGHGRR